MNQTLYRALIIVPLVIFLSLAGLFYYRLGAGDPSRIPSALIGKEAPEFSLAALEGLEGENGPIPGFSRADLNGAVSVVNVWASWCVPCREEMPTLDALQAELGGPGFEVVPLSVDRAGAGGLSAAGSCRWGGRSFRFGGAGGGTDAA